jgi:2-(1,2-epoxy-1,2-dihydrophenyl)acetyl-CoA isomerase
MSGPYQGAPGLDVALDDGVLELRLARPGKRNALSDEMVAGLIGAVEAGGQDEKVRVIKLSATGDHFCTGFDIVSRNAGNGPRPRVGSIQRRLPSTAHRLIPLLLSVQVPVVCMAQGWIAGIGLHLVLASDVAIVADDARLWEPFSERGFTADSGASWLLPRRIGDVRARQMLLLNRVVVGQQAAEWGLVHAAVPAMELTTTANTVVEQLAAGPTVALGLTKWLLFAGSQAPLEEQLRNEAFAMELSSRSDDCKEGMSAFTEKRPHRFTGR